MLEKIPKEVFMLVLELLPDRTDLVQLCVVSRKVYDLSFAKLYEIIIIRSKSEYHLERINTKAFLIGDSINRLQHTRHIQIKSHFRKQLNERCPHMRDFNREIRSGSQRNTDKPISSASFQILTTRMMEILQRIQPHSLKSFSWELGVCIPEQVLGCGGYLSSTQTLIENLTLLTRGDCYGRPNGQDIDLSNFRALQRLSWNGVEFKSGFKIVYPALRANSKQITHLRLEFATPEYYSDGDSESEEEENTRNQKPHQFNTFARECLGLKTSTRISEVMFPTLTSLSLSFISLMRAGAALPKALNINGLLQLTLRECPDTRDFLREIAARRQTLKLKFLECNTSVLENSIGICQSLMDLFSFTPDLNDLFLSLSWPDQSWNIYSTLGLHRIPVTRYVYHLKFVNSNEPVSELEPDGSPYSPECSPMLDDIEEEEYTFRANNVPRVNVKCFGSSCTPSALRYFSMPSRRSLQLLHLRKPGRAVYRDHDLTSDSEEYDDRMMEYHAESQVVQNSAHTGVSKNSSARVMSNPLPTALDTHDAASKFDLDTLLEFQKVPRRLLSAAQWAFGPDGIPSLQVLAFGDFSFNGRYKSNNHILCRQACKGPALRNGKILFDDEEGEVLPFRPIRATDVEMMELVNKNMDLLAACLKDTFVKSSE